ncbi:STAS domain-containing protein [Conexibacter stalactiti]|uniref:Anti-sigma factor antagonist n=1 Tax=Conexibacter stalactiti TaxID=1940611 RepID=A0ABU4I0L5_9ACTN|nr:STAS domain-containing protein [Conexibacter stalactiti]MDW5598492.1 STAS domain-containing protein [Conexibacter stalactiti]MEC5039134.1 STAS domain-containing protein [Conexibacter stalactiti]
MTSLEPTPAFDVSVERREATLVAAPAGELDLATAPQLIAALRSHDDYERLVIDLRSLSFMDSSGLRLLVAETDRASRGGYVLQLVRGGPEVGRLLRLTRLDEKLPFIDADAV